MMAIFFRAVGSAASIDAARRPAPTPPTNVLRVNMVAPEPSETVTARLPGQATVYGRGRQLAWDGLRAPCRREAHPPAGGAYFCLTRGRGAVSIGLTIRFLTSVALPHIARSRS